MAGGAPIILDDLPSGTAIPARRGPIIVAIFLTYFVFAILLNSVGTVIAQVIRHYGVDETSASILEPCKDLPIALVSLMLAAFLPRIGFRRAMLIGLGFVSVACLAMPLVPSFWTTKLLFVTIGISFGLVKVSAYSTIGLITRGKAAHVSMMSTMEGIFQVGTFAGYWLFAWFITAESTKGGSWLTTYWLLSGLSAAAFVTLLLTPFDESAGCARKTERLRDLFIAKWKLLALPLTLIFVACAFLYVLIEQGLQTWMPHFNESELLLPPAMSVQAASIFAACLAIGRLSAGALVHRFHWHHMLSTCVVGVGVLIGLSMLLTGRVEAGAVVTWSNAPVAAYLLPLSGLFLAPIYPTIVSIILSAFAHHRHAAMSGLIVIFSALGGTTGSIINGFIFEHLSGRTAFALTLVPLAGLLVVLYVFRQFSERYVDDEHPQLVADGEAEAGQAADNACIIGDNQPPR